MKIYTCKNCNFQFKNWRVNESNKKEVCPICGMAKSIGMYEEEKEKKIKLKI